jgi:4'-phosphopantetheinyl transferase
MATFAFLHCWQADLAADSPAWAAGPAWLSPAEQARCARLRTPALRQTYGRAHSFLRGVLSTYASLAPAQLEFGTTHHHKPVLVSAPAVQFNLSYRAGQALLAVSNCGPVGVDVELIAPLPDAEALVAQLFSEPEQAALQAATAAAWWPLFYTIWTRKEAYAKALGMGLALPFAGFSVLAPGSLAGSSWPAPAGGLVSSFAVGGSYQGALATHTPLLIQHLDFLADF